MSTYHLIPIGGRKGYTIDEAIALAEKQKAAGTQPPNPLPPGGNAGGAAASGNIELAPITIPSGLSIAKSAAGYIFSGIKYQNRDLAPFELSGSLLDHGATKTYADWLQYSQTNPEKWSVIDPEIIYQCLFSAYQLKNDSQHQTVVKDFTAFLQGLLDPNKLYLFTSAKFKYHNDGSLEATLSKSCLALGPVPDKKIKVPEFTIYTDVPAWSYLVLSQERPETDLAKVRPIPKNAEPLLETTLGENYQQAGAVFSYFSVRKNSKLRESRLWTPAESNRAIGERLAAFGVDEGFDLDVSDYVNYTGPALGVRVVAPKIAGQQSPSGA